MSVPNLSQVTWAAAAAARSTGMGPGVLGVTGICPPSRGSHRGAGEGGDGSGTPKPHPAAPPWLALLRKLQSSTWPLSGESFLSGDTKLSFKHGQSAFALSVGRSKALKHQTCSQTSAEVNCEYKNWQM